MGEPAAVGDWVVEAIGLPEGRADACHDVRGGVGSDDATQTNSVSEMSIRVPDAVFQTPAQCVRRRTGQASVQALACAATERESLADGFQAVVIQTLLGPAC